MAPQADVPAGNPAASPAVSGGTGRKAIFMNEQEYKAARGELERLEARLRDDPDADPSLREYRDTLRRGIEAHEQGARSKGRPPSPTQSS